MVRDHGRNLMTEPPLTPAVAPQPPAPVVEIRDLVKSYPVRGGHGLAVRALDGVSLAVDGRSTYGLVGESGCGKTTLGRLLLRLERPDSGQVTFDGPDLRGQRGGRRGRG